MGFLDLSESILVLSSAKGKIESNLWIEKYLHRSASIAGIASYKKELVITDNGIGRGYTRTGSP